jgi:hypothetical protein
VVSQIELWSCRMLAEDPKRAALVLPIAEQLASPPWTASLLQQYGVTLLPHWLTWFTTVATGEVVDVVDVFEGGFDVGGFVV